MTLYEYDKTLDEKMTALIDQTEDIFEYFSVTPVFNVSVIENEYGGNPEVKVDFTYAAKHLNGKPKQFILRPAIQTGEAFINEIRAYMFDCVDAFVNLL